MTQTETPPDIPPNTPQNLSSLLQNFIDACTNERTSFGNILDAFHERGFGVVLCVFAAPMALPIPVPPGINILLALPLILLTMQQTIGRHTVWLPEKIRAKELKSETLRSLFTNIIPWVKRLEVILRPRLGFMTRGVFSYAIGFAGLIMALSVCVPIPLSNTVPSLGIVLMSLGVIMRDGLAVLAGALIGLIWVFVLFGLILFFGMEAADMIKEFIKGLL